MKKFKPKTARIVIPVSIKAPVEKVFPLCGPVEEYKWIPSWKCELIHCPNDRVELGTIFSERSSAPFLISSFHGKTTWTAVTHDPENYKVHFRLDNSNSSSIYKIELEDNGKGGTGGKLDFTYTPTNRKGNALVGKNLEGKIHTMVSILNAMLQHYCENNEFVPSSKIQKMISSNQSLSSLDKIRLGLNRLVASRMKDENRGRFINPTGNCQIPQPCRRI
jgi:hypothetical protein